MARITALPEVLHTEVATFIGLDYLRLRACSRAFRALLAKDRKVATHLHEGDLIIHIQERGAVTQNSAADNLAVACREGRLTVAQWIATHFNLTADDARHQKNRALRVACWKGRLSVAQWLVKYFGLNANDVRGLDNRVLQWTCDGGHLHVVRWLVTYFKLTAADIRGFGWSDLEKKNWLRAFQAA
jgi:hypothetical protein